MANQSGSPSSQLAETREQLTKLRARHKALVDVVVTGFERIETDIDRLKTTIVEVRLGVKELQVSNRGPADSTQ